MTDWLNHRFFNPDPEDEVRVLGFQGASALARSREEYQRKVNLIMLNTMHGQAGKAEHEAHLSDEEIAKLYSQRAGLEPILHEAASNAGYGTAEGALKLAGIDPARVGEMIAHPRRAWQEHQAHQAELAATAERTGKMPGEFSIGIIPFGETGGAVAARIARKSATKIAATEGAERTAYDAATVDLAFNEAQGHEAVAKKYGLDPNVFHHYADMNSERLTKRILSNRPVWKEGHPDYDAAQAAEKGKPLRGLPPKGSPSGEVQNLATSYMEKQGMPYTPPRKYAKVNEARAKRIAKAYEEMKHDPHNPRVAAAYDKMIKETLDQYESLIEAGYRFEFPEGEYPYKSPWEAMADLKENKHLYVFPTEAGFGTENLIRDHPLLADSGMKWGGKTVTHNDIFRGVHDVYGHFKEGVGFRADGEENAWRSHSAMYSEEARAAMTSETRGQNSWVNFGPHAEKNRLANEVETVYADQKAGLLPEWAIHDGSGLPKPADPIAPEMQKFGRENFHAAAGAELEKYAQMARDVAKTLPESEWPAWVKNQLRRQAVGPELPTVSAWPDTDAPGFDMFPKEWVPEPPMMPGEMPFQPFNLIAAEYDAQQIFEAASQAKGGRLPHTKVLPPHIQSPADVVRFMQGMRETALQGELHAPWYREGAEAIQEIAAQVPGQDVDILARKLAKLVAVYSPRQGVSINAKQAIAAMRQWFNEGEITVGMTRARKKAERVMRDNATPLSRRTARKTRSFYGDFLRYIDPEAYARRFPTGSATIDTWMRRYFGYPAGKNAKGVALEPISDASYTFMEDVIKHVARQMGWTPDEVQAAVWTAFRDRYNRTLSKRPKQLRDSAGGSMAEALRQTWSKSREEGLFEGDPRAAFKDLLERAANKFAATERKGQKRLDQIEDALTEWAMNNPDEPYAQKFLDLQQRAHEQGQAPSIDETFGKAQYPAAYTDKLTPKERRNLEGGGPGKISGGAPGRLTQEDRWQTYGNLTAWKPQSPSTPTAYVMRAMDRFQERLASRVDELRLDRSKLKRAQGKALTPFSARRTVPINRAKRVQRLEPRRARGRTAEERRILHAPGHFMGVPLHEGDQMAHAIWIQLPEAQRNVEGLKLWRQNLQGELEDTMDTSSTGLAARLDSYIEDAKGRMKTAGQEKDVAELYRAQAEIAELQALKSDIIYRQQDQADMIKKLDKLIEKPPKYDPDVATAAKTLNDESEAIIASVFPEEAATFGPRTEKVSRWLGLEPTGEELYLHHGLPKGGHSTMTAGVGVGRITKPAGVGQRLGMTLARTGRVRLSLEPVIEHWQQAQSYLLAKTMRDDLAKMGTPITERPGMRPHKDDIVINPEGRPKPRAWERDPEVQAAEENFNPEDHHINKLEDYTRSFIAEGKDREALIQEAIAAGQLDQLRVVPKDVFYRYTGQYKEATAAMPAQLRPVGKAVDAVNTVIYASLIYANPGYIPANLVANFIMHFGQAGVFVPFDFARALHVLQARGPRMQRLRDQLRSEVGHGPTVEAGMDIDAAKSMTRAIAMIPDDPVRMSAFLHEAAKLKVIPKVGVRLREKDIVALEKLLNDPNFKGRLNDIQDRAVQAMVDFERLGPLERAYAKRVMFVWSWMRGASRYPGRFALDHPGRTAVMAYVLAGAPGAPKDLRDKLHQFMPTVQKGMPPWLEGALHVGGTESMPLVMPTRQISPISTPYDLYRTATAQPGAQTIGELLNPAIPAAWHIANRESPYGKQLDNYGQALLQAEERLAPTPNLIKDLVTGEQHAMYPDDKTRLGRFERSLRVIPYHVDMSEAQKSRVREGMTSSVDANVAEFHDDAQKYLGHPPPPEILHQARLKFELDKRVRDEAEDKDRQIDYWKALHITVEYLKQEKGIDPDLSSITTQGAAHEAYLAYRKFLYAGYSAYDNTIQKYSDAEKGKKHVSK